ncbi:MULTISPECIES: hypothetical protein [unclassified Mesorhizobium]|uniref:hypothetical protein n=1 Tax=unclassified Mesorhizobium TaxID=325217 RepID=UPI003335D903
MNTALLLMAQYGGKAINRIDDVCRDYLPPDAAEIDSRDFHGGNYPSAHADRGQPEVRSVPRAMECDVDPEFFDCTLDPILPMVSAERQEQRNAVAKS